MKIHLLMPAGLLIMLLSVAFMTGSPVFFLIAMVVFLTVTVGLVSVLWTSATLTVSAETEDRTVRRGDHTALIFNVRHRCLIPIAPVVVVIPSMSGGESRKIQLRDLPGRLQSLKMPIIAAHVGVYSSGITSVNP